jgi:thiol-disulfide isomerase/thioredoxin
MKLRGLAAPELALRWRAGQEQSWETLRGKIVVLDFWGTWCGPCVAAMPDLIELSRRYRGKPVEWMAIHTPNMKSFEDLDRGIASCVEKNWKNQEIPFTTALDAVDEGSEYAGLTSKRFGIAAWPTLVVIDPQGKVVGAVEKEKLVETIERLLEKVEKK